MAENKPVKSIEKSIPKRDSRVKESVLTQRIYVGPNLLELQKYTVVEDKFTRHIEELIEKCPSIGKLFVPIEEMAYVEKRAAEKGTLEYRHFNKVIEYASGKDE